MDENNNTEGFGEVEERESQESTEETSENVGATESEEPVKEVKEEAPEAKDTETKDTEEPELTEKGTKLDSNPQSALHQQLANERRAKAQMEQVLGNPETLAKFMKQQYGVDVPVSKTDTQTSTKRYKAEDFSNLDDVAGKFNELQEGFEQKSKSYEEQIKQLGNVVSALAEGSRESQLASTMEKDVSSLRSVPELKPGEPDFIDGLESKIAAKYVQLDFDEQTGRFRGQTTLKAVADDFIEAIRLGRTSGSQRAQTIVKDKTEGRVRTSAPVKDEQDTSKMNPGDSIAAGIARLKLR